MMTVKLSYAIITSGVLLALSGCGGSGSSSFGGGGLSTPYRSASVVTTPKNTNSNNNAGTTQNTTNQTQNTPQILQNPTINTGMASTATAFATNINDSKALNITRVVRPTDTNIVREIQEIVRLTNAMRAEKGLKPLQYDDNLSAFAQVRANEIEINYDRFGASPTRDKSLLHLRMDGRPFYDGVLGNGGVSENVYASPRNSQQAMKGWRESPPHYANIMNANHERIGVGVVYIPNSRWKYHWVQIFGSGTASFPYEFVDAGKDNAEPLKQVVVDGRTIPLNLFSKGQWQPINDSGRNYGQFTGYDHTRFGAVTANNQTQLFYQGNQTLDYAIPKSGTANYRGTALVIKDGKTDTNIDSQFTANFGTRKLNGTLSQRNNTLYTISADINGSGFASKKDAPVQTQGAFFGQNAQELAGVFKDTKTNARGVYGAKK